MRISAPSPASSGASASRSFFLPFRSAFAAGSGSELDSKRKTERIRLGRKNGSELVLAVPPLLRRRGARAETVKRNLPEQGGRRLARGKHKRFITYPVLTDVPVFEVSGNKAPSWNIGSLCTFPLNHN
ncbi:hypothetical protein E2320_002049, partial [Naja naja]